MLVCIRREAIDQDDGIGITAVRYADGTIICGPCHHNNHGGCLVSCDTGRALYECECGHPDDRHQAGE